ncbi:MAG: bis(5'-nucleosyl)-tetraphosphatase (symmetrical) YqeK [Oscillospiraceae bacterium]|nr:bis(5'-nucleosyl)-tetraphosphatase (symmetrical) YqeK [Oscillospiraceae bacterium]
MEKDFDLDYMKYTLKKFVNHNRYLHSINVSCMAEELGLINKLNIIHCKIAGLLHDIMKDMPIEFLLNVIKTEDAINFNLYKKEICILHGLAGAIYVKNTFNINNNDIYNSIKYHTVGRVDMSDIEKVIFVSDSISYDRDYKDVERLRKLAFEDIDIAVREVCISKIFLLVKSKKRIHFNTLELYHSF